MSRPYIFVHMMMSIDGRIDCNMTAQLKGNAEYYSTLSELDAPSRVSGRVTAQTELTRGSLFESKSSEQLGKEDFAMNRDASSYNIVTDTKGTLNWADDSAASFPHLILTSEKVSKDYLNYLNSKNISWIATGKDSINLKRAMEILGDKFSVKRLAVVGGGKINGGFLAAKIVDEISIVIGPGIDGRIGQSALFDMTDMGNTPISLKLKGIKTYEDGAVWLRYLLESK